MTGGERMARAVLLFHGGTPWTADNRAEWEALTGSAEATTKVLGDLAREVLADERAKGRGDPRQRPGYRVARQDRP